MAEQNRPTAEQIAAAKATLASEENYQREQRVADLKPVADILRNPTFRGQIEQLREQTVQTAAYADVFPHLKSLTSALDALVAVVTPGE